MSCNRHDQDDLEVYPVDKKPTTVVEWMEAYDALMARYQELIHSYEEIRSATDSGHRDEQAAQQNLDGRNPES